MLLFQLLSHKTTVVIHLQTIVTESFRPLTHPPIVLFRTAHLRQTTLTLAFQTVRLVPGIQQRHPRCIQPASSHLKTGFPNTHKPVLLFEHTQKHLAKQQRQLLRWTLSIHSAIGNRLIHSLLSKADAEFLIRRPVSHFENTGVPPPCAAVLQRCGKIEQGASTTAILVHRWESRLFVDRG